MIRFITILLLISVTAFGQRADQKQDKEFTVMFYNVENLFDLEDDPATSDEEFTPTGEKEWTKDRYEKKLEDIVRVIMSLPAEELPAIIGLSEVENETVLRDLIDTRGLRRKGYKPLIIEGEDPRGIDCALLYREDFFKYDYHQLLPVKDLSDDDYKLRPILHVVGDAPDGKPVHIYVNHWKSRWGGVKETEPKRVYAGIALRREMDRLLSTEQSPRVIIMGDFNDDPTNKSMLDVLKAGNKRKNIAINDMYNLHYDIHNLSLGGSLNYQGNWQMYDQIILSYSLLNQSRGLTTGFDGGKILKEEWMLYHDERNGIKVPNRTYGGPNYYGGISDHFPVYVTFWY